MLEPTGRNTAPALTLAALAAMAGGTDPVLVVTPPTKPWPNQQPSPPPCKVLCKKPPPAQFVILGVPPTHPETGYGYIQCQSGDTAAIAQPVQRFVENPPLKKRCST